MAVFMLLTAENQLQVFIQNKYITERAKYVMLKIVKEPLHGLIPTIPRL